MNHQYLLYANFEAVSVMVGKLIVCISLLVVLVYIPPAFAQISDVETSKQVTISGDLATNPVAQDILNKIEKSKKWIEQLQQKNFEEQKRQRELDEKRAEVLQILEEDLKNWESLWEYYTFDNMLERALENSTARFTDSIYDHPLKFTASKIHAGRDAMQQVLLDGGGPKKAQDAFAEAAKITREEMISANIFYNILTGNAYYNQQILFDSDGQFHDIISGEHLRKYYQDYKTNPSYLAANPYDKIAREETSQEKDTQCRSGYVLVYRTNTEDYVCVTEQTSEMWIRHDMGKLASESSVTTDDLTLNKLRQDRIDEKIKNINHRLDMLYNSYETKIDSVEKTYDAQLSDLQNQQHKEEQKIVSSFNMSKDSLNKAIQNIRDTYDVLEENMSQDRVRSIEILKANHEQDVKNFVSNFENMSDVKVLWNSDDSRYEVVIS